MFSTCLFVYFGHMSTNMEKIAFIYRFWLFSTITVGYALMRIEFITSDFAGGWGDRYTTGILFVCYAEHSRSGICRCTSIDQHNQLHNLDGFWNGSLLIKEAPEYLWLFKGNLKLELVNFKCHITFGLRIGICEFIIFDRMRFRIDCYSWCHDVCLYQQTYSKLKNNDFGYPNSKWVLIKTLDPVGIPLTTYLLSHW